MFAVIEAIEFGLPKQVLNNEDLAMEFPDWPADKILAKTGIQERRVAAADQCASDLAFDAAMKLLESGVVRREDVDFILFCTQSPDYFLPTSACVLQARLGLPTTCGGLDFNLGCSGYIYGLGLAKGLIESRQASKVLFLTGETYSKYIHPLDKSVRTIFGDAGTATLIVGKDAPSERIGPFVYGTDGTGARNLMVPTGASRACVVPEAALVSDNSGNQRTANNLFMNGAEIFSFTMKAVPNALQSLLQRAGTGIDGIDFFILHQANKFMLDSLQKKLQIPKEKFWIAMEKVGNTVSSTIPIALKQAIESGRIKKGATVALIGFGVGYSWGATLIRVE